MPTRNARNNATVKSASYHRRTNGAAKLIAQVLQECIDETRTDLSRMLKAFAYQEGMTASQARTFLEAPVDQDVMQYLLKKARRTKDPALLKRVEQYRFKLKFTRKMAFKEMLDINVRRTARQMTDGLIPVCNDLSKEAFLRTSYEIQKAMHVGFEVGGISEKALKRIAEGQIGYTRTTYLTARSIGEPLDKVLLKGVMQGKNPNEIGMALSKVSDVVPWKAKGIARTAVTEIANDVEVSTLRDAGVEKYRYLATLDETTCPVCGGMDNKVFDVEDKKTGTNCPPMHPNCRCTTTVAFTKTALKNATRSAKDGNRKWTTVPADMTYSEWKAKFVK